MPDENDIFAMLTGGRRPQPMRIRNSGRREFLDRWTKRYRLDDSCWVVARCLPRAPYRSRVRLELIEEDPEPTFWERLVEGFAAMRGL